MQYCIITTGSKIWPGVSCIFFFEKFAYNEQSTVVWAKWAYEGCDGGPWNSSTVLHTFCERFRLETVEIHNLNFKGEIRNLKYSLDLCADVLPCIMWESGVNYLNFKKVPNQQDGYWTYCVLHWHSLVENLFLTKVRFKCWSCLQRVFWRKHYDNMLDTFYCNFSKLQFFLWNITNI